MAWMMPAAMLAGSALSFGGSLLSRSGQQQSYPSTDWNLINEQERFSESQLQEQMNFQREMAQSGIGWRVNDAQAHGISPLVALGAPTFSPSLSLGNMDWGAAKSTVSPTGGGDIGGAMRALGSGIGDIAKYYNAKDLADAQLQLQRDQLERQNRLTDADIALKGAQAAYFAQKSISPPAPSVISDTGGVVGGVPGQGNFGAGRGAPLGSVAGGYENKLPEVEAHSPGAYGVGAGRARPSSDPYWTEGANPRLYYQPSQGSPASQGDVFASAEHWMRNRIMPNFSMDQSYGTDPGIYNAIRQKFPDAIGYKHAGYGYYVPIFPRTDAAYRRTYRD